MYRYISSITEKNGGKLSFSEETFLGCAAGAPGKADISEISDSDPDNRTFLSIMYYKFTGKLPEDRDLEYWADHIEHDSRYDFRKHVTEYFSDHSGSEIKTIINNVF